MPKTDDALKIIDEITGEDLELQQMVASSTINAQVAQLIYDARNDAGLTQQELADLIETKQSVIARLEDADYDGHSLSMLQRIATALKQRITIGFMPLPNQNSSRGLHQQSL